MKVVLLAIGSRGDVQPMVALGRELAARDIPVTVVALKDYTGLVEAAGLACLPIDSSMFDSVRAITSRTSRIPRNPITFNRGVARWLASIAPQVMAAELAAITPGDLVVAGVLSFDDAAALRDIVGCRVLNVLYAPILPTAAGPSSMVTLFRHSTTPLNRAAGTFGVAVAASMATTIGRIVRADHGLPRTSPAGFVRLVRDTATLFAVSSVLVPPAPDWPAHVVPTGPFLDPEPDWQPSAELREFLNAGSPPVFVSFGSVPGTDPLADVDMITRAATIAGRRVVIGSAATGLPVPPANVHVLADAPYRALLPLMAGVVQHGGAGTTTEALLAGVPTAVVAVGADQPFYGRRVHELGAGPRPGKFASLNAQRLAALLTELTGPRAAGYRAPAGVVRDRIRAEHGVSVAADRVIDMLNGPA